MHELAIKNYSYEKLLLGDFQSFVQKSVIISPNSINVTHEHPRKIHFCIVFRSYLFLKRLLI
jgi:hypothetical protein